MFKRIPAVVLLTGLASCNYLTGDTGMFRDRGGDYRDAQVLPTMVVPAELDSFTLDQLLVIPEQFAAATEEFDRVPLPKPIETGRREGVIIQNLGDRRWVIIDATPAQVWPSIRDYWTQLQVLLDYENPSSGIMETAWVEVDSDIETRHKYRVTIEPGLHSGYSEIYVTHLENLRSDPLPIIITWPATSSSPDRERQILDSVSQYLADRNDIYQASSASLLAGSIESDRKANIIEASSGDQVLELRIDFERAWVQVRQALDAAEIVIVESDRDLKSISVKFAGSADEDGPGFIARVFGRDGDGGLSAERDFSLRFLEAGNTIQVIAETAEVSQETEQLRLELLQVINDNLS